MRPAAVPTILLAGLLVLACGGRREAQPPPNLVLVTVDTLRADFLGVYGSTETSTPHVDRLAAEGTRFENAAAPLPVTRPALFSILTSRYPREHGVTDNDFTLPADELTVAEVLREAGYRTGAFTGVGFLDPASGAAQGFDTFDPPEPGTERTAGQVVRRATDWLRSGDPEQPFFLWIHVFDPHMPYAPPAIFRPPGVGTKRVDEKTLRRWARHGGGDVRRGHYRRAVSLYAGEVEAVDAAFGLLELELRERGLDERTATVFTADHGECMENGFFFRHGDCLYDGAIRVPLIVRYPGRVAAGRRVAPQVEHLDLAPTLLAFAGVAPPEAFGGRPLFARDGGLADLPEDRYALIQQPLPSRGGIGFRQKLSAGIDSVMGEPSRPVMASPEQVGVRSARWKYLVAEAPGEELYDLQADPGETRNLADERRDVVRRLHAELRRLIDQHPLTVLHVDELDPELRRQLEALGYL